MTYDWSLHPNEIAIMRKYHGIFGKSSQLEALEVLEKLKKCVKRRRTVDLLLPQILFD